MYYPNGYTNLGVYMNARAYEGVGYFIHGLQLCSTHLEKLCKFAAYIRLNDDLSFLKRNNNSDLAIKYLHKKESTKNESLNRGARGPHGGCTYNVYVQLHRSGFLKVQLLRVYSYTRPPYWTT